jgi:hypothetical protein
MKENYSKLPEAIEIHPLEDGKTDVILRKNIEEVPMAIFSPEENNSEITIYQCDELQFRYSGEQEISTELIESDFDSWWEYAENWTPTLNEDLQPSLEERVSACEESIMALIDTMFNIDEGEDEPELQEEGVE